MNIVLSGPFGLGSISDEIVLAGVLKPLRAAKHDVTVLTADKAATAAQHGVETITLPSPSSLMSSNPAWKALDKAHFFAICSAGVISDKGKIPARVWLAQLEYARQMKMATGVLGVGAIPIPDKKECVRAQRFMHHFADGVSVRDEASKTALVAYGLNANRVSVTGDPTLALFDEDAAKKPLAVGPKRIAFFFADGVPMRHTFQPDSTLAPAPLAKGLNALMKALNAEGVHASIFHDASRSNAKLARTIAEGAAPETAMLFGTDAPMAAMCASMASCTLAITDTLHGLLFAAAHAVPAIFFHEGAELPALLAKLGTGSDWAIQTTMGAFDPDATLALVKSAMNKAPELRASLVSAVSVLAKKEAQNARLVEKLVPKRNRYPKDQAALEARANEKRK
ncbi:MAG: polysaccharide pyruvyl transferase family protein [Planctomycetota bacterium]